jgi:hypothetical protein
LVQEDFQNKNKNQKNKGTSNITIRVVTLKITSCTTMWKKRKKRELKSYILRLKIITYGEVAPQHHINFGPNHNYILVLQKDVGN